MRHEISRFHQFSNDPVETISRTRFSAGQQLLQAVFRSSRRTRRANESISTKPRTTFGAGNGANSTRKCVQYVFRSRRNQRDVIVILEFSLEIRLEKSFVGWYGSPINQIASNFIFHVTCSPPDKYPYDFDIERTFFSQKLYYFGSDCFVEVFWKSRSRVVWKDQE